VTADLPRRPALLPHPYVLLTLPPLLWASNVVLGRGVAGRIPPTTLNSLRWTIALVVLLPMAWPQLIGKAQIIRAHFWQLVLLAVPSVAIYNSFIYLGTRTTTAANAGLIVGAMPIAILVLAALIGRESVAPRRALGVAMSFIGMTCVIARGDLGIFHHLSFSTGDFLIVGSMLSWATYTVLLRRFAVPLGAFALLAVISAIGLALCIPFCLWELASGEHIAWSIGTVAAILYVGIFPSVVATTFWIEAIARVGACTAGIFTNLIPVFAVLMAVTLLGETLERFQLVGMGLIFAGIWLATIKTLPLQRWLAAAANPQAAAKMIPSQAPRRPAVER
jgi:drug/metabolite transporter (DMT)-like permease